jgi:hypothetical protein
MQNRLLPGHYILAALGAVFLSGHWAAVVLRASDPVREPRQVAEDFLLQDVVRHLTGSAEPRWLTPLAAKDDAQGGCDGVIDGRYGFHTSGDDKPWWQVDLGETVPIDRVVIFNRCDGNVQQRAARLEIALSANGQDWTTAYQHAGTVFSGQTDGKPLSVPLSGATAKWVRIQLPEVGYLHLDEVQVFAVGQERNRALRQPADQSSISAWSKTKGQVGARPADVAPEYRVAEVVQRGLQLAADLARRGLDTAPELALLQSIANRAAQLSLEDRREVYLEACAAVRALALRNPLLDFKDILFVKRVPGTFTHMSDENYGWFSRPGGGLYVLQNFKSEAPTLRCLTAQLPPGNVHRPDLSYDGQRVLFAYCRHYPGLGDEPDKLNKNNVPEDAFYHLFEINLDGGGLRQLTHGKYDDFDGHYLPDGRIVFLSTRRGQYVQCNSATAAASASGSQGDCYVRCGGGPERPVAVYTLHVIDGSGDNLQQISAFEMFEWTPHVDDQGRILYARWDYVDRYNMPFMSLWSTMPDGTNPQAVFGNYTRNPHCIFETRSIPNSRKLVFTASAHHAMVGGCLVLLDPSKGADGDGPMTRLSPEVCFPESEGWPHSYFANPHPLAEEHYLVAWSGAPLPPGTPRPQWGMPGPPNDLGLYLYDAFGNLNLVYRDPEISSMFPTPVRPRSRPQIVAARGGHHDRDEGRVLVVNVYEGLAGIPRGSIQQLRIVGVPAKTHPTMNFPSMGITRDDPGKFVIGTVPVEPDGSAFFRVPSGVSFFVQALDGQGMAVQTMRSATYVQSGQSFSCIGCHEQRNTAPPNTVPLAALQVPARIHPGPDGSWPLDYQVLVQPVLEKHCVRCHQPNTEGSKFDLTAAKSYDTLVEYGTPSLRAHVQACYLAGRSVVGSGAAQTNALWPLLAKGHYDVQLGTDDRERLIVWMDTYAQLRGAFDEKQEEQLRQLRQKMAGLLIP